MRGSIPSPCFVIFPLCANKISAKMDYQRYEEACLGQKGGIAMTVEASLVERIEALSRSEFRASVNATRRATLAIGALD